MIFRQLFDPTSSTYTYLLADEDSREAILIDPVFEQVQRDSAMLKELGLKLLYTVETHVHADHVTGGWLLRDQLGSKIVLAEASSAKGADIYLKHGDKIAFGKRSVSARATPGHTAGCMTYVLDNEEMAFTGDALLIRGCGRTDFQGGSAAELFNSVRSQIFSLPDSCRLYPGHDYRGLMVSTVAEEKEFNPRLGGQLSEGDFVGYMDNLGLDHPKKMDIAVPANLKCGKPDADTPSADDGQNWGPLSFTFAGIWEVEPQWLEEHLGQVQVVDVREAEEYDGPLGHIPGAKLLPLGSLKDKAEALSKDTPIVTVCRAGGRSAQATNILKKAGFSKVANLPGGMLRWRAQHLTVEGGLD